MQGTGYVPAVVKLKEQPRRCPRRPRKKSATNTKSRRSMVPMPVQYERPCFLAGHFSLFFFRFGIYCCYFFKLGPGWVGGGADFQHLNETKH